MNNLIYGMIDILAFIAFKICLYYKNKEDILILD